MGRHSEPTHAQWTPEQPDRRQAVELYAFHLSMMDAWARAMTPVWFVCLLGALFGISTEAGRLPFYALGAVSFVGTFGSTWLLSRRAFTWQYRRPYHWWNPKHHWQAHGAYRNFQAHFPVVQAWQVIFAGSHTLKPIIGSRAEDRPPR